jgi:predicted GIY-YIG superfamily endonuclease
MINVGMLITDTDKICDTLADDETQPVEICGPLVDVTQPPCELDNKQGFKYFCYIIYNSRNQTYNGYTTNLNRRLRQHNGYISGGARATHGKGPWEYLTIISSVGWDSISCAMRHEWSIKYPTRKRPRPKVFNGAFGRIDSLYHAFEKMSESGNDVYCYILPMYKDHVVQRCCSLYPFLIVKAIFEINSIYCTLKYY